MVGGQALSIRTGFRAGLLAAVSCAAVVAATDAFAQPAPQSAGGPRPQTLADALTLAYQTNPTLLSQRATLRALDETYVQARAGYRPQVSAGVEADYAKNSSTFNTTSEPVTATLSASQPIYTGGYASASVRAAEGDIRSGREQLRQTEATVLQSVIGAYVDVRRDQQALTIQVDNVNVLRHQLAETKAKFEVGQITRTDVAQAEARLAQAQAQLATSTAQLGISRAAYVANVGQSPGDLAQETPLDNLPITIDEAFSVAEKNNGGILAADYAEQAAAARVAAAKAANRPTLSLRAGLGNSAILASPPLLQTEPIDRFKGNFTASAVFTQPLFTGGLNSSRIRQALEDDNTQRIAVETARRQAVQLVSQAWNQLMAARAGVSSNQKQVDADQVAYEGTRQESLVGLRTTLDVLNAEQELHNAQLSLVNSRHDQFVASASVLNAMGRLEVRYLTTGLARYDAVKDFNRVRGAGWSPTDPLVSAVDAIGSPHVQKAPPQGPLVTAAPVSTAPVAPAQAGSPVLP